MFCACFPWRPCWRCIYTSSGLENLLECCTANLTAPMASSRRAKPSCCASLIPRMLELTCLVEERTVSQYLMPNMLVYRHPACLTTVQTLLFRKLTRSNYVTHPVKVSRASQCASRPGVASAFWRVWSVADVKNVYISPSQRLRMLGTIIAAIRVWVALASL